MLEHGGRLVAAARRWGIPENEWLDLSTGINPEGWPVPELPAHLWRRLPEEDGRLEAAAAAYYGQANLVACPGSQAAIALLPRLWSGAAARVGVIGPTYAEHAQAWRRAGHHVTNLTPAEAAVRLTTLDVLVVVNPDNPTGRCLPRATLLGWAEALAARRGWLIVDEAFMDPEPGESVAAEAGGSLVVLRSLGKFFGLAGLRLGFILGETRLLEGVRRQLGPWAVATVARHLGSRALCDGDWQQAARTRLAAHSIRLHALLSEYGLPPAGGTALFQFVIHPDAAGIHEAFAAMGVLVRRFEARERGRPALRFGLPGDEAQWAKLRQALAVIGG